jgi:hypothetical protein
MRNWIDARSEAVRSLAITFAARYRGALDMATFRTETAHTVVLPKEKGQMRLAGQASRSNTFPIFWAAAADHTIRLFLDLEGYLRKLALRVTWPSFANTLVYGCHYSSCKPT